MKKPKRSLKDKIREFVFKVNGKEITIKAMQVKIGGGLGTAFETDTEDYDGIIVLVEHATLKDAKDIWSECGDCFLFKGGELADKIMGVLYEKA